MRTSSASRLPAAVAAGAVAASLLTAAVPALAFDGTTAVAPSDRSPVEAFRTGARAYYAGDKDAAVDALSFAADKGHPLAQWKLGRMYAAGDGVAEDDMKAFEYFRSIANAHADEAPSSPDAPFVANAFVELGSYYLSGIKDSAIEPNARRAREIFSYAASYFGDANAQFQLARMYLDGSGGKRDGRQAARWLQLAAKKGHYQAQALLGKLLVDGEVVPQRPTAGLTWLTIARHQAVLPKDQWILDSQEAAFAAATETQRRKASSRAESWIATYASAQ
ncbi:hypothetical protein GGD81_001207 [Rhodobium orientis]|uniref:Exopolysaccharide biosynthesis protein n=1 Tax=Rhodobium orientis TaxID=34017 RepID=A0A327JSQ0_9HYPH|nr:tetratricopeptide repeat protein [Rhodobium orientis]MBB4302180.1 hypothetical protein [Rhodobium orientis]MBK5948891.1 exopolysaccharide biosynthesis protein [Rhodobium orientis]RAI27922.1 exopolysaccharide biosynthesis protein [Rhodobium orientis]